VASGGERWPARRSSAAGDRGARTTSWRGCAARGILCAMRSLALVVSVLGVAACDSHLEAKVGGAILPQAYGVVPAPPGPTVVVRPGKPAPPLPPGPVRVAIDLHVPWSDIRPLLDAGLAAGSQPVLLVGQRNRLRGFVLDDVRQRGPELRLDPDGKGTFCLSPPGTAERYCVEAGDHRHISSIYVREAVQKAVKEYGLTRVRVRPADETPWGDLVRTIDGARTCCDQPVQVTVAH
jgi:hypothetical protein